MNRRCFCDLQVITSADLHFDALLKANFEAVPSSLPVIALAYVYHVSEILPYIPSKIVEIYLAFRLENHAQNPTKRVGFESGLWVGLIFDRSSSNSMIYLFSFVNDTHLFFGLFRMWFLFFAQTWRVTCQK